METTSGTPAETTPDDATPPGTGSGNASDAPRLAAGFRRPAVGRRPLSWLIAGVVAAVVIVGGYVAFWSTRDEQPLLISLTAPEDYSGWLVVSWDCAGGRPLADGLQSGDRYAFDYADDGTLCLADPFPERGYRVLTYNHASVTSGRVASPFLRAGPSTVHADSGADTVLDPAIESGGDHHYDATWVEVRDQPEGRDSDDVFPADALRLGDQCALTALLQRRFGEPAVAITCGALPTRYQAGLEEEAPAG